MKILALDTATAATTVALADTDPTSPEIHTARDDPPVGARPCHSTRLLALVEEVLDAAGLAPEDVDRVAVGLGPGTFTGLRIGVATALGLARAAGAELVGVPTLAALALGAVRGPMSAEPASAPAILALLDARRGEVFGAGWIAGADPLDTASTIDAHVLAPEALPELLTRLGAGRQRSDRPALAVGDGAVQFREILRAAGAEVPPSDAPAHRVDARQHARLAALASPTDPRAVRPLYLRCPDARPSRTPTHP